MRPRIALSGLAAAALLLLAASSAQAGWLRNGGGCCEPSCCAAQRRRKRELLAARHLQPGRTIFSTCQTPRSLHRRADAAMACSAADLEFSGSFPGRS